VTATEWLALGGLVLSGVLGVLGFLTGREAREDARTSARETREAASNDARAARLFDARRSVYIETMDYVYLVETWVDRTEPFMSLAGELGPPEFPSEEDARRQSAAIATLGSRAIRTKLDDYRKAVREFQFAVWALHDQQAQWKHWVELRDAGVDAPEPENKEPNLRTTSPTSATP
jgi:hypothetical protein